MPLIRPAVAADEVFLLDLTERLADFALPPWRTAKEIADADDQILLAALRAPSPETAIFVAEAPAGSPVGYIFVSTRNDYFTHERHAHVEVLVVDTLAEGRGVGRALLAAAEAWSAARGDRFITLNVWTQNTRARAVYDHLGYEPETVHYRKGVGDRK